jgi:hypothetical protein
MTRALGVKAWATGAVVLAAVAACASSGDEPDPPIPSSSSSSATPTGPTSASPTASEADVATEAAEAVLWRYFVVLDTLRQNPRRSLDSLASVATSTQLAAQRRLLGTERSQELRQIGTTALAHLIVQAVNLDNQDPQAGLVPTVTIDACWDVSAVDIVDVNGQSVVSPDRASSGWTRYTIANYRWSKDPAEGWRVATGRDLEKSPCRVS